MLGADSTSEVLYYYLRALSVKVSRDTVYRLLSDSLGNSMQGISNTLNTIHIKNKVYQIPTKESFHQVTTPFITTRLVDKNPFCVITKIADFIVEYSDAEGKNHRMEVDKFLRQWTGVVLVGERTERTPSDPFYALKNVRYCLFQYKIMIVVALIIALGFHAILQQGQPSTLIAYLCTLSLGIFTSIAILYKEQFNEGFLERFCHIGKITDCNGVLHSKGANIAGIGLGQLSLLYFSALFFFTFTCPSGFYGISVICCILATGFTLYSIIYQSFILHRACILCMMVNLIVWSNVVILYILKDHFETTLSISSLSIFVVIGCICLILGMLTKTFQKKHKEEHKLRSYLSTLLNPETFHKLLTLKPHIEKMIDLDTALHNQKSSENHLMIVTNPNCKICMKAHRHIKEISPTIPTSLVLLTFPNDRLGEQIAQIIIAVYLSDGWEKAILLLEEWHDTRNINEVDKYSITPEAEDIWKRQQIYCWKQNIDRTPSIIVNGHYVPEVYPLSELRYVLT